MSKSLIKTKNPTNLKPNSWHEEYFKLENDYILKHPEEPLGYTIDTKEYDIMADKNQSHDRCSGFLQFEEKNNLEINKELLVQYKKYLESLPLWKSIKDIEEIDNESEQYCILQTSLKINKCLEVLKKEYLITAQLEDIKTDIENYWINEQSAKSILDLFKQFKFENYQQELYDFIKQNTGWRNKERDFEIYNKHKKGTLYSELAESLDLTISAISKINKRVQSSINNLKGKFFEIEYEKYLRTLNRFRNSEVIRDGAPGKPDIYIVDDKDLYVLSLKNLELKKNSECITIEQLTPELKFAYNNSISKKFNNVFLYLIVFDSVAEQLHIREVDYKNPSNLNVHR